MLKHVRAGLASALLLAPVVAGCQATASTGSGEPSSSVTALPAATTPPTGSTPPSPVAVGSVAPRPRHSGPLPPTWGPAANGLVLYGTTTGEVRTVDMDSGATATIIDDVHELAGATTDGTRMVFERTVDGGTALWIADIDGTHARQLLDPGASAGWGWIEGTPDGTRMVMIPDGGGDATIFDLDSGAKSTLHPPVPIREASWLADGRLLVVSGGDNGLPAVFATIAEDGTGYAVVPTKDAIEHYSISGDGMRFAYDSWSTDPGMQGQIHVMDLRDNSEIALTRPDVSVNNLSPVFSPDDRWVMVDRYDAVGSRIVLFPADGKGKPVELGPEQPGNAGEASPIWAPDGSALIVTYPDAGETWMLDIASGTGAKVDWPGLGDRVSWQRVAP